MVPIRMGILRVAFMTSAGRELLNNYDHQAKLFGHAHALLKTHETLLRDGERNVRFHDALRSRVTPGSNVLDIGAGTGIWAIAAAKIGAAKVVAVDMDELLVGVIRMLADEHGVSDRVEAICASSFDLQLGRQFDVVVSETIGYLGYDERIVEVMADSRTRFLREGGYIIPESVELYAAAGNLNVKTETIPIGSDFEFELLTKLNLNSPRVLKNDLDVTLLTSPSLLISTDLRHTDATPPLTDLKATWDMPSEHEVDCVIAWVESSLAPGIRLSTRQTTSWFPTVYRIEPPARPFEKIEFTLSLTPTSNYWTATFVSSEHRESRSYSPEYAATQMIAAARGAEITNERGRMVLAWDIRPPSVIELREARADDEAFLRKLYHSTRADEVNAFGWSESEQDSFLTMQFEMQQQAYQMQFPDAECSIILFDDVPAGRLIVDRSDESISLTDITLAPEFRGRGIGSRLIRQLQREGKAIVLSVDKQNLSAMRLYEKLGFTRTGEAEFSFSMRWDGKTSRKNGQ